MLRALICSLLCAHEAGQSQKRAILDGCHGYNGAPANLALRAVVGGVGLIQSVIKHVPVHLAGDPVTSCTSSVHGVLLNRQCSERDSGHCVSPLSSRRYYETQKQHYYINLRRRSTAHMARPRTRLNGANHRPSWLCPDWLPADSEGDKTGKSGDQMHAVSNVLVIRPSATHQQCPSRFCSSGSFQDCARPSSSSHRQRYGGCAYSQAFSPVEVGSNHSLRVKAVTVWPRPSADPRSMLMLQHFLGGVSESSRHRCERGSTSSVGLHGRVD
jgi:hypothetical protein